jgi:hypothetical protein
VSSALVTALVYLPPSLDLLPLVGSSTASLPRLAKLVPSQALGVRYISSWIIFRTKRVVPTYSVPCYHRRCVVLSYIGNVLLIQSADFGGPSSNRGNTGPFWIGSGLAILSALITFFFISPLSRDGLVEEDRLFREYLEAHGYDTSRMGFVDPEDEWSQESVPEKEDVKEDAEKVTDS